MAEFFARFFLYEVIGTLIISLVLSVGIIIWAGDGWKIWRGWNIWRKDYD